MSGTRAVKREQLSADLAHARQALLAAVASLRPDERDVPFLGAPGSDGAWSAHDIVAHLIGWDYANLEAIEAVRGGRLPAFYAHYDYDWRTFNAGLVARHKQPALEETIALAQASHQALLAALAGLPADDVSHDYGVRSPGRRRVTIAMLLASEARDELKHAQQIQAFAARGAT